MGLGLVRNWGLLLLERISIGGRIGLVEGKTSESVVFVGLRHYFDKGIMPEKYLRLCNGIYQNIEY